MNSSLSFEHLFTQETEKKKRAYISTPHQAQGIEYAKKLGATTSREFGQVIKLVKMNAGRAASAYAYAIDYPNAKSLIKIFFWRYYHPQ